MIKKYKPNQTVIIGAGLAGLATGYYLKTKYQLFEAQNRVGGECVTDYINGYAFDKAGHLLHLKTTAVRQLVERLCPNKWRKIERDAHIHIMGTTCCYPFQGNLFNLPTALKGRALLDYLQAAVKTRKNKSIDFETWSRQYFGNTITDLFMKPYNEKLWTVPASTLTLDWMENYVPQPEVKRVLAGAFSEVTDGGGYNARFYYPKKGGIDQLAQALARQVKYLHLNSRITEIDIKQKTLIINGNEKIGWNKLISTIPLPALAALIKNPDDRLLQSMKKLKWNSVLVVNLGIKRAHIHPAHWLYFPEKKYCFYRVGFPSNFGHVAPSGHSSMYVEVALEAGTGWETRNKIVRQVRRDLIKSGILHSDDQIDTEHCQYIPYAYVIYDQEYAKAGKVILEYFKKQNISCIGRWGHWEYSAMEDALLAGKKTAKLIKQGGHNE